MANMKLPLGVVAAALSSDPRAVPTLARAAGFHGLQFDAYSSALDIPDLSASGKREFRRLLSSQDQQLVGLRWDAGPHGLGPGADVDRALARVERVMEAASGLAAPLVSVELGPLPEPAEAPKPKPKVTREQAGLILLPRGFGGDGGGAVESAPPQAAAPAALSAADLAFMSQVDGALAELCRRADRYSVTLALRSELASFAALERALRQVKCPWFGIDLDPVAVLRDAWDVDEVFSRLGNLIRHVRGRDAVRGANRRTKPAPVGGGNTDWEKLQSNLDEAGYAGWVTVDPIELTDRAGAARQAQERLAKLRS
jgi:sugar phosphate isomerase/epimerase